MHVLADRAVLEDAPERRREPLPLPLVARNLVDMTVAALGAPVSAATREEAADVLYKESSIRRSP
jgi:hypothetical protein